jgi:hypothetical protein
MDAPAPVAHPVSSAKNAPSKLGKIIKGHKPVVYVGLLAFAVIVAYIIHQREKAATVPTAADTAGDGFADGTMGSPALGYGTGATYDGTQGAAGGYYGYNDPTLGGQVPGISLSDIGDLINAINAPYLGVSAAPAPSVDPAPISALTSPTGGGAPAPIAPSIVHAAPASAKTVANLPAGAPVSVIHDHPTPPDPRFPFLSTRGWYAVVINPPGHAKGRYHKYANGLLEKVG